jgi:hypothetical protein
VSDFAPHMVAVAKAIWGDPNTRLSTRHELRWGTNGSKSVDIRKGVWRDHETDEGGGVLDLLRINGHANGAAFDKLRSLGIEMERREPPPRGFNIVAEYDYRDENDKLVFQVVRLDPKDFRQRKPAAGGGWEWGVRGATLIPYRLPELIEDLAAERTVYIVEGEKAVDYLRSQGIPATCNPMGAKKWDASLTKWFEGADVIVVADNDRAGREHVEIVCDALNGIASVRLLDPPGVAEKGGLDDWMRTNSADADALGKMALANAYARGKGGPFKSRYGALWLHELMGETSHMAWVVKGVVPAKAFGGIVGEPSCGKSFLGLDLAFTTGVLARTGADWFGHRTFHGGVVYLAAEGQAGFIKRVRVLTERHKIQPDPSMPFVLLPTAVDLCSPEGDTAGLIAEIQAHAARMAAPLSLVFVDTLNRAMGGGDENSSEDMGAFIRACDRIREATGATVVVVHHLNASGTRERGHTSFKGALDFMLSVEGGVAKSFRIAKQKDGEDGAEFGFRLVSASIGIDEDGDKITSCFVEPVDQERASRAGSKLSPDALLAYRLLVDCTNDQGRGVPIAGLHNQCGVTVKAYRDYCKANQLHPEDGKPNSFYVKFNRVLTQLRVANRVGASGDWVWVPR